MATINLTGFETGSGGEAYTTSGTIAYSGGTTRGSWSLYSFRSNPTTTGTGSYVLGRPSGTAAVDTMGAPTAYLRFYVYFATLPSASSEPIAGMGQDTSLVNLDLEVRVSSAGVLSAYDVKAGTPVLLGTGSSALATGTWYRIEMLCSLDGVTMTYEVRQNGTTEISGTNANTNTLVECCVLGKYYDRNGKSVDFYYDDILVSDSTWPGVGQSGVLLPNAAGTYQTFTRGGVDSGANYSQVNEVPPDSNNTYLISTGTTNDAETEAIDNASVLSISGTIACAKLFAWVARDGASNGSLALRLRSNTTNSDGSTGSTSISYGARAILYDTDPATSAAWTASGLDSVQVGCLEKQTGANKTRVSALYLLVDWNPGGSSYDGSLFAHTVPPLPVGCAFPGMVGN